MHNAFKDGKLKFVHKKNPRVEEGVEPKVEEVLLAEPVDIIMVDITDDTGTKEVKVSYEDYMKVVFLKLRRNSFIF